MKQKSKNNKVNLDTQIEVDAAHVFCKWLDKRGVNTVLLMVGVSLTSDMAYGIGNVKMTKKEREERYKWNRLFSYLVRHQKELQPIADKEYDEIADKVYRERD